MKKNNILIRLNNQPVANRFKSNINQKTKCINLTLVQDQENGLIQLKDPTNPKKLQPLVNWLTYNEPEDHLDLLVEELDCKFLSNTKANIGGLSFKDDSTLNRFKKKGHKTWRLNNENDLLIRNKLGVESIQAALTKKNAKKILKKYGAADLLIVRHIWEHVFDQEKFAESIKILIKENGIILLEIPDCSKLLESKDYTMLWEEHLFYYTMDTLISSISKFGFQIVYKKITNYPNEPSINIAIKKTSLKKKFILNKLKLKNQITLGKDYKKNFLLSKKYVNHFLNFKIKHENYNIAVFGAGHLSIAFISFFNLEKYISVVFDDNKNKQNLYLPNMKIKIVSSNEIKKYKKILILLSVSLTNENKIIEKIKLIKGTNIKIKSIFPLSKHSIFNEKAK